MTDILLRAGCFVAVIALGWLLRRIGFFKEEDFSVLSRITIRITLPGAIVTSFVGKQIDPALLTLSLLGLGGGILYMAVGFLISRRRSRQERAFDVLNLPGYGIGTFTLPFVQSFLGPMGVITASIFDIGNACICLGGAYSVAVTVRDGKGFSLGGIGKALIRSVPLLCHVTMLVLTLAGLSLPAPVVSFAKILGDANPFMAMLMIGVGFRLSGDKAGLSKAARLLAVRYGLAAVLAAAFWMLPFAREVRMALVILAFSPFGSAVPGFTEQLGGDVGLSSAVNSMSILLSTAVIVVLLGVML